MPIPLNVEVLACAYDYLCCLPPFDKWNLPPADEVKFLVIRRRDRYAHFQMKNHIPHIAVSSHFVGRHEILISTMAHEMIHLHVDLSRMKVNGPHDSVFQKIADKVCKLHEFDRLTF